MSTPDRIVFATPTEILSKFPNDIRFPPDRSTTPTPGRGIIGSDATYKDGRRCISIFEGAGRWILIDENGEYVDDDVVGNTTNRTEEGAWIPESLYRKAVTSFESAQ